MAQREPIGAVGRLQTDHPGSGQRTSGDDGGDLAMATGAERVRLDGRPGRGRASRAWGTGGGGRVAAGALLLLAVAAGFLGAAPAAAQAEDDRYTDDEFGWSIDWDPDVWEAYEPADFALGLGRDDSYVLFQAYEDYDGEADACLEDSISLLEGEEGVDDVAPLEDEDGEPIASEDDGEALAAFSLTYTEPGADADEAEERFNVLRCFTLTPGETVLFSNHIGVLDRYEDEAAVAEDLFAGLALSPEEAEDEPPATPTEDDEDADADEGEETEGDDAEDGEADGDGEATPDAEDAAGDDVDDGEADDGEADDGEEATEAASDQAATEAASDQAEEDEEESGAGGIDGNTYTSPSFGYTLEWDEDLWSVDEETEGPPDRDTLVLDYADGGFVFIEGYEDYDGDPAACLEESTAELLEDSAVENSAPLEDEDGEEVGGEEDGVVFAGYAVETESGAFSAYLDCRAIVEGEAVLAFTLVTLPEVYDGAVADTREIAGSLELTDDATPAGDGADDEPSDDATPSAEAEAEDGGEDDDDAAMALGAGANTASFRPRPAGSGLG